MTEKIYLQYNKRLYIDTCPKCEGALVWRITDKFKYTPCDTRPVMCCTAHDGNDRVVYKGEIIRVKILTKYNAKEFIGVTKFYALVPHTDRCSPVKG